MGNKLRYLPIVTMGFSFASLWKNKEAFIMQNYKDVCKNEDRVWFEIDPKKGEQFLTWAKEIGLTWLNGEEINLKKEVNFFHFSVSRDGKLTNVPYFAWHSKDFENVTKYYFPE
jgi:hypothetical protein